MIRRMMTGWNISPASRFLLGCMILLMLLIVLIPDDVDLPDAAFDRGTSPVLVHAQATSAPATVAVAATFQLPFTSESLRHLYLRRTSAVYSPPNFRPIVLRSIRL